MPRPPPSNEIREGNRGGWGHFKWEDVKTDKHRMNYLANSLFAPVGRWQQGRDLTWYAKQAAADASSSASDEQRQRELAEIKRREQDYMNAALGYGPVNPDAAYSTQPKVSEQELKVMLAKTNTLPQSIASNEVGDEMEREEAQMERGLGFGHSETSRVAIERLEGTITAGQRDLTAVNGRKDECKQVEKSMRRHRKHRSRSRSRDRQRSRSRDRKRTRSPDRRHRSQRDSGRHQRSRSPGTRQRHRSRSTDKRRSYDRNENRR